MQIIKEKTFNHGFDFGLKIVVTVGGSSILGAILFSNIYGVAIGAIGGLVLAITTKDK